MAKDNIPEGLQGQIVDETKTVKRKTMKKPAKKAARKHAHAQSPQATKDKPSKSQASMPRNLIAGVLVIVVVLAAVLFLSGNKTTSDAIKSTSTTITAQNIKVGVAQKGDIVTVDYTGTFENGTVFVTTDKATAEANQLYSPLRTYEPIKFALGDGNLITGFDGALDGMTVGQEKEFTLSPENAYGYPIKKLIQYVERKQRSPIVQNVSIDRFIQDIGADPKVGMEFRVPNGTNYQLTWPMKVLAVSNDTVTFRFVPDSRTVMKTVFGDAVVYGEGEEIVIEVNAKPGQKIVTLNGPAVITGVNDENITVDFNHELAGKNLKFKVKLTDVVKQ